MFKMINNIKLHCYSDSKGLLDVALNNSYCLYTENFLASMAFDEDEAVRRKGILSIKEFKKSDDGEVRQRVKKFEKEGKRKGKKKETTLDIDLNAAKWDELVKITPANFIFPPCLKSLTENELMSMIECPSSPPSYPIHGQSVERAVRLTTEVSTMSADVTVRNSIAFAKIKQRLGSTFKSKKDWH